MYDLNHDIVEAVASTPDTLAALLQGVSDAQARAAVGGDENWSVVEVLCHLRDAEEFGLARLIAMRDQENPKIIGFDQDELARERKYNEADLASALDGFLRLRAEYLAALRALTPDQWKRTGQHNEIGQIDIFSHALHRVSHDSVHCAQIARQLGK